MTPLEARDELAGIEVDLAAKLKFTYPDAREEIFQRFIWPSATSDGGEDIAHWKNAYYRYLDALWPEHVQVTEMVHGPFAILVDQEGDDDSPFLVVPESGSFATKAAAIDYLRSVIQGSPEPFLGGLKFKVLQLSTQASFKAWCSW